MAARRAHRTAGSGRCDETGQNAANAIDFVVVDLVAHARIDFFDDVATERREHAAAFANAFDRDVGIDIGSAQKDRRARQ
mgnify:CR=1 FL=1